MDPYAIWEDERQTGINKLVASDFLGMIDL
jgi:hypothetical protein